MPKTLAALLLLLAACAQSQPGPNTPDGESASADEAPPPGSPAPCTAGQEWFTSAPSSDSLPGNGCYTRCDSSECPSGQVCRTANVNPCGPTEDGEVRSCTAASQQSRVCLTG